MNNKHHAEITLPERYALRQTIDLAKNKKEMTTVTVLSVVLLAASFGLGFLLRSGASLRQLSPSDASFWMLLLGYFAYLVLHEAVHGIAMWHFSRQKPSFGISLQYAYAGSKAYFYRNAYLIIALAPLVVWSVVFITAALLADGAWFWVFWILQACNLSDAAGDLYVFWKVRSLEPAILVQDDGVCMRIYAPVEETEP